MSQQRKTVTVVFADLVESTASPSGTIPRSGPILRRYFEALRSRCREAWRNRREVHRRCGRWRVRRADPPRGRRSCARSELRLECTRRSRTKHRARPASRHSAAYRVGVNTGQVVASSENALGHAISMAARLEQNAPAGDVLIGRQTYALVEDSVDAACGGHRSASRAHTIRLQPGESPACARSCRRVASRTGVYVGRDRELEQIQVVVRQRNRSHACVTVTVIAPPGLGKSRLIAEAVGHIGDRARVLVGRCLPYGEGITYAPLVAAVAQLDAEDEAALDRALAGQSEAEQVVARVEQPLRTRLLVRPTRPPGPSGACSRHSPLTGRCRGHRRHPLGRPAAARSDRVRGRRSLSVGPSCSCVRHGRICSTRGPAGRAVATTRPCALACRSPTDAETAALLSGLRRPGLDRTRGVGSWRRRWRALFVEQMAAFDAESTALTWCPDHPRFAGGARRPLVRRRARPCSSTPRSKDPCSAATRSPS